MRGSEASAVTPIASLRVGHRSPAGGFEALRATGVLDRRPQPALAEEAHREAGVGPAAHRVRQREENAGAVAGDAVRGPRTAVPDRREPGERAVEHVARRAPAHVRDEADAARIALSPWVVQKPLPVAGDGEHLSLRRVEDSRRLSVELVRRGGRVSAD